jgi:hypothetical protein
MTEEDEEGKREDRGKTRDRDREVSCRAAGKGGVAN